MPARRTKWSSQRRHGPRSRILWVLLGLIGLGTPFLGLPVAPTAQAAPATVVTLTFDDGTADEMAALPILAQHNMHGTFFIISGAVDQPGYLTRSDLSEIAAGGNEIGGHSVSHPDLTSVSTDEARRQICDSRVTLSNWGFTVKSFAYPYAAYNSSTESIVSDCGYNSARTLGDITSPHGCPECDVAGPIPPEDPYNIPAVDEWDTSWTVAQMKDVVTSAEAQGGWVPFTFHHVCSDSGCGELNILPSQLDDFLTWLSQRPTTTVQTVDQVIGGPVQPLVSGPGVSGSLTLPNPSVEAADGTGFPQCWMRGGYGSNTATWSRVADAHTGSYAERLQVTNYVSGDAKLLPTFDLGSCSPTVAPGQTYEISAWYKSTAVTQFALYYRTESGAWYYWTSSPWFAAATDYTQATWTTPAVPAGATGMSFGLNMFHDGTITTDDYSISATTG